MQLIRRRCLADVTTRLRSSHGSFATVTETKADERRPARRPHTCQSTSRSGNLLRHSTHDASCRRSCRM